MIRDFSHCRDYLLAMGSHGPSEEVASIAFKETKSATMNIFRNFLFSF